MFSTQDFSLKLMTFSFYFEGRLVAGSLSRLLLLFLLSCLTVAPPLTEPRPLWADAEGLLVVLRHTGIASYRLSSVVPPYACDRFRTGMVTPYVQ